MIEWGDVYKVVAAMVPLYVALILGYGSVRWWHVIKPEQCDAINRLVCYFTIPFFTFDFTTHVDPFRMNFRFIGADSIAKVVIVLALVLWANCTRKGSYIWSITIYSLSTLNNTLVVGVPLLKSMYGHIGEDLVIQSFVLQSVVWVTILLFVLEFRRCGSLDFSPDSVEMGELPNNVANGDLSSRPNFCSLMSIVWLKLAKNPNIYACVLGLAWAFLSNRWHFQMPSVMEGSILIMSKAGSGTSMFSMGLFMALQEKMISCGFRLTLLGMVLRFIAAPASMAIGALALGLRGDVLRIAIVQAALPQSITSFIFAKEYGLHADVLSTAVIFGTLVSLPVLIAYYAIIDLL